MAIKSTGTKIRRKIRWLAYSPHGLWVRKAILAAVKVRNILAHNLRKYRMKSKLTQEQLAWKAKLTPDFIGRIERAERTVSLDNLEKIAKVLGIELCKLIRASE